MKTRVLTVLAGIIAVSFAAGAAPASAQYRKPAPGNSVVVPTAPKLPAPDLTVATAVTYLVHPCAVEGKYAKIDLDVTVKNAGPGPAYAPFGIEVRTYPSRTLLVPATYAISAQPVVYGPKQLNPGESATVKLAMTIGPAADNKPYDIMVQLDRSNAVAETNEGNNIVKGLTVPALVEYCTAVK